MSFCILIFVVFCTAILISFLLCSYPPLSSTAIPTTSTSLSTSRYFLSTSSFYCSPATTDSLPSLSHSITILIHQSLFIFSLCLSRFPLSPPPTSPTSPITPLSILTTPPPASLTIYLSAPTPTSNGNSPLCSDSLGR